MDSLTNSCNITCPLGYYKNDSNRTCNLCRLECSNCTSFDQCTNCKDNYYLVNYSSSLNICQTYTIAENYIKSTCKSNE